MASAPTVIGGDLIVQGSIRATGGILPTTPRTALEIDDLAIFPVELNRLRIWDAFATLLPATSSSDDLGLYTGTWGSGNPYIGTGDRKAGGAVNVRARFLVPLPAEYVPGQAVQLRLAAGMQTTIADVTATIDVEAFKVGRNMLISGSDLVATAAQDINNLVLSDKTFQLSGTPLLPGDLLDVRLTIAINDAASATAVIGILAAIELLCDIQG